MEQAAIILGILGIVFGLIGLVASFITATIVIGWKNSTHRIEYRKPEEEAPTRFEVDAPKHIIDQLPSAPEPQTLEQWMRQQAREQNSLDAVYEQDLE